MTDSARRACTDHRVAAEPAAAEPIAALAAARPAPREARGAEAPGFAPLREPLDAARLLGALDGAALLRNLRRRRAAEARSAARAGRSELLTPRHAADLAELACDQGAEVTLAYLEALRDQGAPVEALILQLLPEAARRLGADWEDDRRDFTQVTLGLARLHHALHGLSDALDAPAERVGAESGEGGAPRAVFAPAPGDQHAFGAAVAAAQFRAAGWDAEALFAPSRADIARAVRAAAPCGLFGLSISGARGLKSAPAAIAAARAAARAAAPAAPEMTVLVGGPLALAEPDAVAALDADAVCRDAGDGLAHAERRRAGPVA